VVVTVAVVAFVLGTLAVPAVSALHVDGIKILMDVQPGRTYTSPMGISIGQDDPATDYAIDVMGFGQSGDGTYRGIPAAEDVSPFSARPFVSVTAPSVHLDPGGSRSLNATIRVPADIGAGGRYATIYIHPTASQVSGAGAGVATAVLVPVMLTVQGTSLTETGSITDIEAADPVEGQPAQILTTLENTGNHHYYGALVETTISDPSGKPVATASTKPSVWALIPGDSMTLVVAVPEGTAPGTYTVQAEARIGEGGALLDTKTATVSIGAPPVHATGGEKTPSESGVPPVGSTPVPAGTGGPKKVPFLPIYTPWPDFLVTAGAVAAVILFRSRISGK
jgi:hypothetical protein